MNVINNVKVRQTRQITYNELHPNTVSAVAHSAIARKSHISPTASTFGEIFLKTPEYVR